MNNEDFDIVQDVLAGDRDKFSILVEKYKNRIYGYVLKNGIRFDDAQDLTQDIFLQTYTSLNSFRMESQFSTWLYAIARNIINNYINRTLKKQRKFVSVDVMKQFASENDSAESVLESIEQYNRLVEDIYNLPDELKETLTLVFFEEFSYAAAAEIMNIPEGTVKSRIFRARKILCEMNLDT